MTAVVDVEEAEPKPKGKGPLLIGLLLACLGGAGGFYVVNAGIIGGGSSAESHESTGHEEESHADDDHGGTAEDAEHAGATDQPKFVEIDPLVISLPVSNGPRYLRFSAQLEVDPAHASDVIAVKPRIVDVMNTYLRAVDPAELEDPAVLTRLRAQLLRRLQVVAGNGHVRDLLVMESVLN